MSPFAIYSKTGKGVQEASGKTSLLDRAARAVLAMVDGRASLAELHERYGKLPESQFHVLIEELEAEGFIRQVSVGKPAAADSGDANGASLDQGADLDFTSLGSTPISRPPAQVDLAARARADAERRRRDEIAARRAREEAEAKARAQADAKARAESEARARAQAEAKARAERDAALKVAAEARARNEAEARERAAREGAVRAALEAKTRAETELTTKLEAERKAREELERKLREQAERLASESREVRQEAQTGRVLSEVEELRQRLEEKRRARDEAERSAAGVGVHADAEGERIKRDADELRERLANEEGREDAERRAREEQDRRAREEAELRAREEEREKARQKSLEESSRRAFEEADAALIERKRKEEEAKAKREVEEREWNEQAERLRREQEKMQRQAEEEARKSEEARRAKDEEEKKKKFLETQTLFADLSAFSEKEVVARPDPIPSKPTPLPEKKPAPVATSSARAAPAAPATVPPKAKPETPAARTPSGDQGLRSDPKATKQKVRDDRRAHAGSESRPQRAKVATEAPRPPKKVEKPKPPPIDWGKVADRSKLIAKKSGAVVAAASKQAAHGAKLGFQWSKHTYAKVQAYRRARAEQAAKVAKQKAQEREEAQAAAAAAAASAAAEAPASGVETPVAPKSTTVSPVSVAAERRRKVKAKPARWGARAAGAVLFLLVLAAGAIHVLPLETAPYEKALSEATGQPVSIGSASGWLITGPQLRFERVRIGDDIRLGAVHASPDFLALLSGQLTLGRVQLERAVIPQNRLGGALFGAAQGSTLKGVRIVASGATLAGPLKLPALDAEIVVGADGRLGSATVRGPDALHLRLSRKDGSLAVEGSAEKFTVPFVPGLELSQFTVAGSATPQGVVLTAWDGVTLGGVLSGTATMRWGEAWSVEGTLRARAMEAGQLAPALVSEGRTGGQGTYAMRASDPSALASNARVQGRFTIAMGTLTKIDLSRAVQTGGAQAVGSTRFVELTGDATYERGAVIIRNARMVTGGALNAEANLDISSSGALSGSVVAELSGRPQSLRTPVRLAGTLASPLVGQQP